MSIALSVSLEQAVSVYKFFSIFVAAIVPVFAFAQEENVTRADAFLYLWEGIKRPAYETYEEYTDVKEGDPGYVEISYGKRRGILPDEEYFRPNEPVLLRDALLWLYRTRNVRELPDMNDEHLPGLIGDYPVVGMNQPLDSRMTMQQLTDLTKKLDATLKAEIHEVSYYADYFQGAGTAFGEKFDMHAITAAHRSFPHNTLVRVTNQDNGDSVVVRINDRGPYVHGRSMDLSKAAFEEIAHVGQGVLRNVTLERLGDIELIQQCEQSNSPRQKRVTRDVHFFRGVPHTFAQGEQLILQSTKVFVVYGIEFPDGQYVRIQDFVHEGEKYRFTPDSVGMHKIYVGDGFGRRREMRMNVVGCGLPV